jgi:hypothetical protein
MSVSRFAFNECIETATVTAFGTQWKMYLVDINTNFVYIGGIIIS